MTDVQQRVHSVSLDIAGRPLTIETGLIAEQAHGAAVVRYGDTVVLVTVVGEREPNDAVDFFPLSVDYEERMYAAGKIPGGFIKREGRPTEAAVLAGRLTDRPIRPLFPKGYKSEVQVISTVMSADQVNQPDILSIIGASAALMLSHTPWEGPVGAVRLGLVDGQIIVNPTNQQLEGSNLDMVVAGTEDAIMMVEGEAHEIPEETLLDAIMQGHAEIKRIAAIQRELQAQAGQPKWEFTPPAKNEALISDLKSFLGGRLREAVTNPDKVMRLEGTNELKKAVMEHFATAGEGGLPLYSPKDLSATFESLLKDEVRSGILREGTRPDGRGLTDIRPIWTQVGYLPRAHGSAIFTRGQTQVMTVVTLGSTAEEQRLDSISPEESKRYIHHYNFPPYSVGEVRRMRGPGRRDIGHGALAERALLSIIPDEEKFPYTMRLVSEVMSSNGSSSMASVCGSTLALMDAGVPISNPVAGVAMGLVTEGDNSDSYAILTDIQGIEDALGDMDFKVAGTTTGVTAIQMDIKVKGITEEILRNALQQANAGRMYILDKMLQTISTPRETLSPLAPRVTRIKINPEKIGAVIGPGGKMIRAIQEETGTKIDIEDDGTVSVSSASAEGTDKAIQRILGLTQELRIERGEIYTGKVVSIMPYGAFVELFPGRDGLVHISELSEDPAVRVNKVEDVINLGEEITVMVTDVAPNGKVSLSRRAALTGELPEAKPQGERGPRRDGDRGPRRDGGGGFDRGGDRGFDRGPRRDGPGSRPSDSRRPSFPRDDE
jgi:polyribonucleotide nucleotidyltransferase